jgi:hypothetical protein
MTESLSDLHVSLGQSIHQQAERFAQFHHSTCKSEQVYLNTLAVYAVNYYLQCLGFSTALESSDSWNPVMQALADVADLTIENYGRLECRPIDISATTVEIPPEVWQDRMGYLVVELDELLESARLLGFLKQVDTTVVQLEELQPLDQLSTYLDQFRQPVKVHLSQWLTGLFTTGWQDLEAILPNRQTEPMLAFRNAPEAVTRSRRIELEQGKAAIATTVTLNPTSEQDMEIQVEVVPIDGQHYLPVNLQITLLDDQGNIVIDAQAREENQRMRLEFDGTIGDQFSLKLAIGQFSVTEDFII